MGGRLLSETHDVDGAAGSAWATAALAELSSLDNVRMMPRTTIYGAYDHGIYGALERKTDHLAINSDNPRQVLWRIYAKRSLLCAGAIERSIAFGNNDRPGIMLAGAVRSYANRFAVTPGKRTAVFTNNDDGWRTATDLKAAGADVAAIIDTRRDVEQTAPAGITTLLGQTVVDTAGRLGLKSVTLSNGDTLAVDCLAVSGGWNPNVHLTCHQRGRPNWNAQLAAFVPGTEAPVGMTVAGAANGTMTLAAALREGHDKATTIANDLGCTGPTGTPAAASDEAAAITAFWHVTNSKARPSHGHGSTCKTTSPPRTCNSPTAKVSVRSSI